MQCFRLVRGCAHSRKLCIWFVFLFFFFIHFISLFIYTHICSMLFRCCLFLFHSCAQQTSICCHCWRCRRSRRMCARSVCIYFAVSKWKYNLEKIFFVVRDFNFITAKILFVLCVIIIVYFVSFYILFQATKDLVHGLFVDQLVFFSSNKI